MSVLSFNVHMTLLCKCSTDCSSVWTFLYYLRHLYVFQGCGKKKSPSEAARSTLKRMGGSPQKPKKKAEVEHNVHWRCIHSALWSLVKFKGFHFPPANAPGHVGDFYLCPLRIKITDQPPHVLAHTHMTVCVLSERR